jgi:hypothetical protein
MDIVNLSLGGTLMFSTGFPKSSKDLHQKYIKGKFMQQLITASKARHRHDLHRPTSVLYGLFRRRALVLLAFLPGRLNDVIYAQ